MEIFYWILGIVAVVLLVKIGINKYLNSKYQKALDKEYVDYLNSFDCCQDGITNCVRNKSVVKSKKAKTSKLKTKKSSK